MERLIQAKLFGDGLVEIQTEELVSRYNNCLDEIGVETTKLKSFHIDGVGWSPEISQEKNNTFYLSHGNANEYAIVITPEQYLKPIHFPFHSFDRYLMQVFFKACMNQIKDITGQAKAGIWIDMDQEFSYYQNPRDLLMIDSILVHAHATGGLMEAAESQRKLIQKFFKDDKWMDDKLIKALIESAEKYGDLRFRSLIIPTLPYSNIRSFYSQAFGGIYVFRDEIKSYSYLMAVEHESVKREYGLDEKNIFLTSSPDLIDLLLEEGITAINFNYYRDHLDVLRLKRECMVLNLMSEIHPEVFYHNLTSAQQDRYIHSIKDRLPEEFFEIERLIWGLDRNQEYQSANLSPALRRILAHPSYHLPEQIVEIVWQLLTDNEPLDILMLYTFNKRRFFLWYDKWVDSKKEWAVSVLKENYVPWVHRKARKETGNVFSHP